MLPLSASHGTHSYCHYAARQQQAGSIARGAIGNCKPSALCCSCCTLRHTAAVCQGSKLCPARLVVPADIHAAYAVAAFLSVAQEACDALQAAHASEAELFASQQPPAAALRLLSAHHLKPVNPKVLRRAPNSISLAPFPVQLSRDAGRKPATFAAYCKASAAGVSLTANKTSTEYPGVCEQALVLGVGCRCVGVCAA